MLTMLKVAHILQTQLIRKCNGPEVGHGSHLTVYSGCGVQADKIENYGRKGDRARKGVNL